MYVLRKPDDYDKITFIIYTDNEKNKRIIKPTLLLTIPYGLSIFCLISLLTCTMLKHFFSQ